MLDDGTSVREKETMKSIFAAIVLGVAVISITSLADEESNTCIFAGKLYSEGATVTDSNGETQTCMCDDESCFWR